MEKKIRFGSCSTTRKEVARQPEGQVVQRMGRPVATFNTADAKNSFRVRFSHEKDPFNVENEKLRERIEKSFVDS